MDIISVIKHEISSVILHFQTIVNIIISILINKKLMVFENMVLRRIFGPRRDEVTGEWRRL